MPRATQANAAAKVARVLASPIRLQIMQRLMDGPAAVADLAATTQKPQPNVSNHLLVLRKEGVVTVNRTGRQAVYEIRDASVAQLVEALLNVAGPPPGAEPPSAPLALARTCYDHLAGKLGVALFYTLLERGALAVADEKSGALGLGPDALAVFARLGADTGAPAASRRRFAYACLDWTERRPHLGGWLGASLCRRALQAGWVTRGSGTRAVTLTAVGRRALAEVL